jgi:hypothetical protein
LPPLLSFPNLSSHYPSILHSHHPLTSLLYHLYTLQPLAIPDKSTLQYNSRNIPKHTQWAQNPAAPLYLPPPTHFFLPSHLVQILVQLLPLIHDPA